MARFRWRHGRRAGRWCATRREALDLAHGCGRAVRDAATGRMGFVEGITFEEEHRERLIS
jgi:hypothetical protein